MADSEKSLNIKITTSAELAGAKELETSLERNIGKAKALGKADEMSKLTAQLGDVRKAISGAAIETEAATEVSEIENVSIREKREAIRALTVAFPEMREAAIFALNPMTLALFGIGGAFELFRKRMELADEAMGSFELPDLVEGVTQAHELAEAWTGIQKAVQEAIQKYDSADSIFAREKKDIDEELASYKQLLDAQKEKALADLELKKGVMPAGEYDARRQTIEDVFGRQGAEAEAGAQQKELGARQKERANAAITAWNAAAAAANIKLPASDEEFEAGQKALQSSADAYRKQAEEARKRAKEIQDLHNGLSGDFTDKVTAVPGALKFAATYGTATVWEAMAMQNDQAKQNDELAVANEKEIARRKKAKDRRDALRKQAEDASGRVAELDLEIPDEEKSTSRKQAGDQAAAGIRNAADRETMWVDVLNKNNGDVLASLADIERATGSLPAQIRTVNEKILEHQLSIRDVLAEVMQKLDQQETQIARLKNYSHLP